MLRDFSATLTTAHISFVTEFSPWVCQIFSPKSLRSTGYGTAAFWAVVLDDLKA